MEGPGEQADRDRTTLPVKDNEEQAPVKRLALADRQMKSQNMKREVRVLNLNVITILQLVLLIPKEKFYVTMILILY